MSAPQPRSADVHDDQKGPCRPGKLRAKLAINWVTLSFVQPAKDLVEANGMIHGRTAMIAKIEKPEAIDRLQNILGVSKGLNNGGAWWLTCRSK